VRDGAPDANLIVDANEAWTEDEYLALLPALQSLRVTLIEQPFHADADAALDSLPRPIPVCADESCHDRQSLEAIEGRYDLINIKLDKTGGLTEALALKREAASRKLGIMVGCMVGSSLAMAPAQLIAQGVDCVDLDGPLLDWRGRCPNCRFRLPAQMTSCSRFTVNSSRGMPSMKAWSTCRFPVAQQTGTLPSLPKTPPQRSCCLPRTGKSPTRPQPDPESRSPASPTNDGDAETSRQYSCSTRLSLEEAAMAREAFYTSATGFVMPVVELDGQKIGDGTPGPITRRLREIYIQDARDNAI